MFQRINHAEHEQQYSQRQQPPKPVLPRATHESAGGKCWLRRFDLVAHIFPFAALRCCPIPYRRITGNACGNTTPFTETLPSALCAALWHVNVQVFEARL